jgi:hypothetical protein
MTGNLNSQLNSRIEFENRSQRPGSSGYTYAANIARFEQSFWDIADRAKIPGRENAGVNIVKLVSDWLCGGKKKWLLILDNVDDAGFLLEAPSNSQASGSSKPLREYLPQSQNGSTLITSRRRDAARQLVGERSIIPIESMGESEAVALFEKWLENEDQEDLTALAKELEYVPLAIAQAAAYIHQRSPRISAKTYLEQLMESDESKMDLLSGGVGEQLYRDWEANDSIMTTWHISFEHIRHTRPSAAELLSLMSFFDRQGIPEMLLRDRNIPAHDQVPEDPVKDGLPKRTWKRFWERRRKKRKDTTSQQDIPASRGSNSNKTSRSNSTEDFEQDILMLRDFSFISVESDGETFAMHRLVQLATQKWLEKSNQLHKWHHQSLKNLDRCFPDAKFENWPICQLLFPHAKLAATKQPNGQFLECWSILLHKAACYASQKGDYITTMDMANKPIAALEEGGQNDALLGHCILLKAEMHLRRGQYDEPERLQLHALKKLTKALGSEHLLTTESLSALATTYVYQGKFDKAEELQLQVVELRKRHLGSEHRQTMDSMLELATIYDEKGKLKQAHEIKAQVTKYRQKQLGLEHPDTLQSMSNLGATLSRLGRDLEAEELITQVLGISEKLYGVSNPNTFLYMRNLAYAQWKLGKRM